VLDKTGRLTVRFSAQVLFVSYRSDLVFSTYSTIVISGKSLSSATGCYTLAFE